MWEDPIIKALHEQRREQAEAFGYDVKALIQHYRKHQQGRKAVSCPEPCPKPPPMREPHS